MHTTFQYIFIYLKKNSSIIRNGFGYFLTLKKI